MLPPVKFNMLGQMQLRGNGGGSSSTTTTAAATSTVTSYDSPEREIPNNSNITSTSKTSTPVSSPSSSDSSTLPKHHHNHHHGNSRKLSNASSNMHVSGISGINFSFGSDSQHQINSAFAWQLANSSQSIDLQDTRSNNQNGCRGAGDGVAVGGLNLNVNLLTATGHLPHKRNNGSSSNFNFQQQHGISRDPLHHQHHKSSKNREDISSEVTLNPEEIEDIKEEKQAQTVSADAGKGDRAESPLDFSTKKKFKSDTLSSKTARLKVETALSSEFDQSSLTRETSDSPCSRLRNILSMKSPTIPEEMAGTVLNLSKESPTLSSVWCKTDSPTRSDSNSSSPILTGSSGGSEHATAFVQSNSPRPATIPISMGAPTVVVPPVGILGSSGGSSGGGSGSSSNGTSSIGLPSWGSGVYSPSLSPILSQTVPANGGPLPLSFDTSPTLFSHHIAAGATSPALSFPPSLSLPLSNGVPTAGSKGRVTRPFKAYPKDPLTFSSVGLYGLPLGTAPGTTEAVIHQQSNQAYAEFRKQMLTSSQFGKGRRAGHKNNSPYPIPSDSMDGSGDNPMFRGNDSGSASDDGGSLTNGKNRLGKSEQQMKDEAYWERRRKNNEAAKRSRDARRAKEDEIAIRAAFLEQENLKLRFEVCALKSETAKLRCMLYSS